MGPRRIAMLLMLAASQACAQPAASPAASPPPPNPSGEPVKRIFVPPPVQWDNAMLSFRPALPQTAADFASLTGGITFGLSPSQVNARMPERYPNLSWNDLPLANEYPGEVRYFGLPIDRAGPLRPDFGGCPGRTSYVVLLFSEKGLFRLSYRLIADNGCADTNEAAQAIFAHYVPIGQTVAMSARYRTGRTQVVDVTDPTAGYLIPTRWRQGAN
jgi:hypothetical protein